MGAATGRGKSAKAGVCGKARETSRIAAHGQVIEGNLGRKTAEVSMERMLLVAGALPGFGWATME